MNIIKGLITKDLLQLKSYRKTVLIFIIVFVISMLTGEKSDGTEIMFSILLSFVFGMFAVASFSYDEIAKSDRYILTMPLTRKEVVRAKYVLVILLTVIGAILGIAASSIITFFVLKKSLDIYLIINTAFGGLLGVSLVEAIQIACIYKWGPEKGRIQIFAVIIIFALIAGGIGYIGEKFNFNFALDNILGVVLRYLSLTLIIVTAFIYYISYRISYRIYLKKEI